jgi:hypothetical protein
MTDTSADTRPTPGASLDRRTLLISGTQFLSIITPVAAGTFALVKYFDLRNRELRAERYKTYSDLIRTMSGLRPDGSRAFLVRGNSSRVPVVEFSRI